jgi:hypothetical protein
MASDMKDLELSITSPRNDRLATEKTMRTMNAFILAAELLVHAMLIFIQVKQKIRTSRVKSGLISKGNKPGKMNKGLE